MSLSASVPGDRLPVASLLFAALLWGLLWWPLRELEEAGLEGLWISLASFAAASVTAPLWLRDQPPWRDWPWGRVGLLLLVSGWTNVAFILAVLDGSVVRVLLLFYLSPVWALFLARLVLGEQFGWRAWGNAGLALLGAAIMLYPSGGLAGPGPALADLFALSAGMAFAAANTLVRGTPGLGVGPKVVINWLGVVVIALLALLWQDAAWPQVGPAVWGAAALLGIAGFVVMTLAVAYGVSRLPLHRSSVIMLFELVVGTLSAQWLASEAVSLREWLGGALIVWAAYHSARGEGAG